MTSVVILSLPWQPLAAMIIPPAGVALQKQVGCILAHSRPSSGSCRAQGQSQSLWSHHEASPNLPSALCLLNDSPPFSPSVALLSDRHTRLFCRASAAGASFAFLLPVSSVALTAYCPPIVITHLEHGYYNSKALQYFATRSQVPRTLLAPSRCSANAH